MVGVHRVGVSKCVVTKHHLVLCKSLIVKEVLTRRCELASGAMEVETIH